MSHCTHTREECVNMSVIYYGNCWTCGTLILGKSKLKKYCDADYKARRKAYSKEYSRKNSKRLAAVTRKYYQDNKDRVKIYMRKRMREQYRNNPQHRIGIKLRKRVWKALRNYSATGKISTAKEYGIDYGAIIEYLKPFPKDQSEYHIDHIRPLCSFDLNNPEQIKIAFAPENHQWLTPEQNMKKGGTATSALNQDLISRTLL